VKLLVLVGSNRADSFNSHLADLAVAELPQDVEVSRFDVNTLPFYSEHFDADGEVPAPVAAFRAEVAEADAILIASPSYNGTMSAQVKNAIDTASRPREHAPIHGKPVAVVTAAYHRGAGESVIGAIHAATTIAGATPIVGGTIVAPHFEAFDEDGSLKDEAVAIELAEFMRALAVPANV
jgi:NAD(P)H-dependent FMN reductase